METWLLEHHESLRLAAFATVLSTMILLETLFPRRKLELNRVYRWGLNLSHSVVANVLTKLIVPITSVYVASLASAFEFTLFAIFDLPLLLAIVLQILILDFAIYWQHRASHYFPILWNLHKVHHSDKNLDASSAVRFHPLEICFSLIFKITLIISLGVSPVAIILFEILLNASALFNHANLRLPLKLDQYLRALIVTPDMHRVHHSVFEKETNSNFGFFLSMWDRLFSSYTKSPIKGQVNMVIGLDDCPENQALSYRWCFLQPLKKYSVAYLLICVSSIILIFLIQS